MVKFYNERLRGSGGNVRLLYLIHRRLSCTVLMIVIVLCVCVATQRGRQTDKERENEAASRSVADCVCECIGSGVSPAEFL